MNILSLSSRLLVLTLLSRILGLVRDLALAWIVGSGAAGDLLAQALRVPHIVRRLLCEGSLSMHLTGAFVRDASPPWLYAALFRAFRRLFLGITLVFMLAAPLAAFFLGIRSLPTLLLLVAPYLYFAGMAALAMAYLHARGVFSVPALAPVVFNLVLLSVLLLACFRPATALPLTAAGFALAGLAQWTLQARAVSRLAGGHRSLTQEVSDRAHAILRAEPLTLVSVSAYHLILLLVLLVLSTRGDGLAAGLFYAERLLELPLGLVGVCLGMASLPSLGACAAAGHFVRFRRMLDCALHWTHLLLFPCVGGLLAVAEPLVSALFCHGNFDSAGVSRTVSILFCLLPALPACAAQRVLLGACFAMGALHFAAGAALFALLATALLLFTGPNPALCATAGLCLHALLLRARLARDLGAKGVSIRSSWAFFLKAAGCAAAACLAAKAVFFLWPSLLPCIASGVAAWVIALRILSPRDLARLRSRFLRR